MPELQNTFSWSHSRHSLFQECLRAYYLNHYGFWGGWDAEAPAQVRETYIQKQLTRRPMWLGTVVHNTAERALRALAAGRRLEPEDALRNAMRLARLDIAASRRGAYRGNPKHVTGFQEHYYQEPEPDDAWDQVLSEIEQQLRQLFQDPVYLRICAVPDRLVEVERLEQVLVGDVPVWVKLDALISDGKGGLVVLDWKTGRQHEEHVIAAQLGVYGLYCMERYQVSADRIVAMHVNLRHGVRTRHPVDPEVLERSRSAILESAGRMRSMLRDVARNEAHPDDFPMLPPQDGACGTCRFRRTCGREEGGRKKSAAP